MYTDVFTNHYTRASTTLDRLGHAWQTHVHVFILFKVITMCCGKYQIVDTKYNFHELNFILQQQHQQEEEKYTDYSHAYAQRHSQSHNQSHNHSSYDDGNISTTFNPDDFLPPQEEHRPSRDQYNRDRDQNQYDRNRDQNQYNRDQNQYNRDQNQYNRDRDQHQFNRERDQSHLYREREQDQYSRDRHRVRKLLSFLFGRMPAVYVKAAELVRRIFKMYDEELQINSVKCPTKATKFLHKVHWQCFSKNEIGNSTVDQVY